MNWLGVYISGVTQDGIIAAVHQAVKVLSDGNLKPFAADPNVPLYPFAGEQLIYVSSQEQNYVACWGLTEPCMHHVMKRSRFSGVLLHTLEEEASDTGDLWLYQVWDAGQITEWFVSRPAAYFQHWSDQNIRAVVLAYAEWRSVTVSDSSPDSLASSMLFSGGQEIFRFAKKATSKAAMSDWLSMSAANAIDSVPEILAIPFGGTVYNPESLAIFADVNHGHIRLEEESDVAADYYRKQYLEVKAIAEVVRAFRPLPFRWTVEPLERDLKYYRFLTWAV